jgi:hypothetical protein
LLNLAVLFLDFAVLLEKLVQQHRVHGVLAHGVNFSICICVASRSSFNAAVHDFVLMARLQPGPCHSPHHRQALMRGKGPVAAVPGAGGVGGHDSEMISGVRS